MLSTELDRTGLRPAPQRVSATERRVAELQARRMTNRDVAAALFISPKTVEANLARAYGKLEIDSRAEVERGLKKWVDSLTNVGKPRILVGPPRSYDRLMSCDVKPGWATVGSADA